MRDPKGDSCDELVPAASICILMWATPGNLLNMAVALISQCWRNRELGAAPLEGCLGCGLESILLCPGLVGADVPCEQPHVGCMRRMVWEMWSTWTRWHHWCYGHSAVFSRAVLSCIDVWSCPQINPSLASPNWEQPLTAVFAEGKETKGQILVGL